METRIFVQQQHCQGKTLEQAMEEHGDGCKEVDRAENMVHVRQLTQLTASRYVCSACMGRV